jgi:hypothetical protein
MESVVLLPPSGAPLVIDGSINSTLVPTATSGPTLAPDRDDANSTEPTMAPVGANSTMAPSSNATAATSSNATTAAPSSAPGNTIVPTTAPANTTSLKPTLLQAPDDGIRRVALPRTYIAFSVVEWERPPTPQETVFVVQLTTLYFEEVFTGLYADADSSLERVEMELVTSLYEEGIPEERYNIYLEFNTSVVFRIVNDTTVQLPQASDLFNQTVEAILDTTYVYDYLWQVDRESPYFRTQEVVAAAAVELPGRAASDVRGPAAKNKSVSGMAMTDPNIAVSGSVQNLEDRFILPGSKLPNGLFRLHDDLEDEEEDPTN